MKRIIVIGNVTGGLLNFRKELLEAICKDHEVIIMAEDNYGRDIIDRLGCGFINIKINSHGRNPLDELSLYRQYRKALKELSPDIVLTYTIKPNIYAGAACAALGIPYIANITGLGVAVENRGMLAKITIPMYRYGIRKAQKVFFQNLDNQEFMIKKHMVRGSYDLLPGSGVNLDSFRLLEYPSDAVTHFAFISRVLKEKGIEQYLEAAQYIKNKYPNTQFHICGNCDNSYREIINTLHEKGIIEYHGRVDDISSIHRISSCTIHPTYYPEGMSNVLLESAACGRPIITTMRPGCKEIVDENVNGFFVQEKNSKDLIQKIELFLSLPWEQRRLMGLAGRKKVENEFDRNIVVQKYLLEIN